MLDVVDMEGLLQGDEEHVSGTITMIMLNDGGMISCCYCIVWYIDHYISIFYPLILSKVRHVC